MPKRPRVNGSWKEEVRLIKYASGEEIYDEEIDMNSTMWVEVTAENVVDLQLSASGSPKNAHEGSYEAPKNIGEIHDYVPQNVSPIIIKVEDSTDSSDCSSTGHVDQDNETHTCRAAGRQPVTADCGINTVGHFSGHNFGNRHHQLLDMCRKGPKSKSSDLPIPLNDYCVSVNKCMHPRIHNHPTNEILDVIELEGKVDDMKDEDDRRKSIMKMHSSCGSHENVQYRCPCCNLPCLLKDLAKHLAEMHSTDLGECPAEQSWPFGALALETRLRDENTIMIVPNDEREMYAAHDGKQQSGQNLHPNHITSHSTSVNQICENSVGQIDAFDRSNNSHSVQEIYANTGTPNFAIVPTMTTLNDSTRFHRYNGGCLEMSEMNETLVFPIDATDQNNSFNVQLENIQENCGNAYRETSNSGTMPTITKLNNSSHTSDKKIGLQESPVMGGTSVNCPKCGSIVHLSKAQIYGVTVLHQTVQCKCPACNVWHDLQGEPDKTLFSASKTGLNLVVLMHKEKIKQRSNHMKKLPTNK